MNSDGINRTALHVPIGTFSVSGLELLSSGEAEEMSSPSADRRGVCSVSTPGEVWRFICVECPQKPCTWEIKGSAALGVGGYK